MPAPDIIRQLVQRFHDHAAEYHSGRYNETQLRREFLDPFFIALGWDVLNSNDYAEAYKDVVHEDSISIGGSAKAPDYGFRIGGARKFFVEAKKPAVNLREDVHPAYQLRRYAWSAKLPLSILTDFEEFAVYDCRTRPDLKDKPSTGRVIYFTYDQYLDQWDEIAAIFSRQAVLKGSFDRYAQENRARSGTADVDDAFLDEISNWRLNLARNIALRNPDLSGRELNYAVQMTIDRIIFLRICEARGIEPLGQLQALLNGAGTYARLAELFRRADERYNSGLFHFRAEKDQAEAPDTLTGSLALDDKPLKEIIENLYYPKSPYEFAVMPAEILGQVYEQFLGQVIRLTPGHRAEVEDKPEVRKAGGVFYTPTYIVEYIVRHTVGELLQGKQPGETGAGKGEPLRVLDPACGSGSFLIGAYQFLLDWYLAGYSAEAEHWAKRKNPPIFQDGHGEWRLTTGERKRILLDHIYGVDIDPQAVEVTKLSLLLKVLEGENEQTLSQQLVLFHARALPDLGKNIRCGNSLIGPDYYAGRQMALLDEEEQQRVNAFDWKKAFPQVFGETSLPASPLKGGGGFDAVIGNPPYVRQEMLGNQKTYFEAKYETYYGVADLYTYFIEKGIGLLRKGGLFSYIVANKWLRTNYGNSLRRWLKLHNIEEIIDFGDLQVFEQATTYPCIIRIRSGEPSSSKFIVTLVDTLEFENLDDYVLQHSFEVEVLRLGENGWSLVDHKKANVLQKLFNAGVPIIDYVDDQVFYGIKTGFNDAFVIDKITKDQLISEDESSAEIIKPFLLGREVKRYSYLQNQWFLIFTRRGINILNYPAIHNYLTRYKESLMPKPKGWNGPWKGRKPGSYQWYEIQDTVDYYLEFGKPKIIYPNISKGPEFSLDYEGLFTNQKCFIISRDDKYLLGILNSSVTFFFYKNLLPKLRGDFFEPSYVIFKKMPIRVINFDDPADVKRHDQMVALVERMLELHRQLAAARTPPETARLQAQIEVTDAAIDRLVYELYGLTEEEIKIVEGT